VPKDWELETGGLLPLREDLNAEAYAGHAAHWQAHGARIIGGCCGTGPEHIAALRQLLDAAPRMKELA
jgi:S-methylmethionine-dependent homocysteine/selenocysteine methylase